MVAPITRSTSSNFPQATSCPILNLSAELLDQIFAIIAPRHNAISRRALARCLRVCNAFAPIVRRHMFAKVILCLGARDQRYLKFLRLLQPAKGLNGPGTFVHSIKFIAPEPSEMPQYSDNPALALVPSSDLSQAAVLAYVCSVLEATPNLTHIEVETRIGTQVEDAPIPENDRSDEFEFQGRLTSALTALTRVAQFAIAVAHELQKLQILAGGSYQSPYIAGLASWVHLTRLDLWRVRIEFADQNPPPPTPSFALEYLSLQTVELGSASELVWLLGDVGGTRSSKLTTLLLEDVSFISSPDSCHPLLTIFGGSSVRPSFASTLIELSLDLHSPLPFTSPATNVLAPLEALKRLHLSGSGTPLELIESIPRRSQIECMKLHMLTTISQESLISCLSQSNVLSNLKELEMQLLASHPRTYSWDQIRATPLPTWVWSDESWRNLERTIRKRPPLTDGHKVVLKRNGVEMNLDWDSDAEGDDDEDDGTEGDWDELFVPSSGDEEVVDWRRVEADEESDF